jgi:hypothetical protein
MSLIDYHALNNEERERIAQSFERLTKYEEWRDYINWLDYQIATYDLALATNTFTDVVQVTTLQEKRALCIMLKEAPEKMIDVFTKKIEKDPMVDPYDLPRETNEPTI